MEVFYRSLRSFHQYCSWLQEKMLRNKAAPFQQSLLFFWKFSADRVHTARFSVLRLEAFRPHPGRWAPGFEFEDAGQSAEIKFHGDPSKLDLSNPTGQFRVSSCVPGVFVFIGVDCDRMFADLFDTGLIMAYNGVARLLSHSSCLPAQLGWTGSTSSRRAAVPSLLALALTRAESWSGICQDPTSGSRPIRHQPQCCTESDV